MNECPTARSRPGASSLLKGGGKILVAFLALAAFFLGSPRADAQSSMTEYQVKALFLLNFIKYVDWPSDALAGPNDPIVIGTIGQNDLYDELQHAAAGKTINGRALVIKHFADGDDLRPCAILFISSSEDSRLGKIMAQTGGSPILTVGEDDDFLQKGGIINLDLKDSKIHLEVNLKAARQVNLEISSRLLSVAEVRQE